MNSSCPLYLRLLILAPSPGMNSMVQLPELKVLISYSLKADPVDIVLRILGPGCRRHRVTINSLSLVPCPCFAPARISHKLTQRGGGDACLRAAHRQAGLTRLATANANEDPVVVLVQYVEEAVPIDD